MKNRIVIITFILSSLFTFNLFSQINTDSLFQSAIIHARSKNYEYALNNAKKVLNIHPERNDVLVFLANVFAWQGNFDSSKTYINIAFSINPISGELYDTWLNVLLWNAEYNELLKTITIAVNNNYNNNYNLTLKQLLAFKHLGEYSKAINLFSDKKNKEFLDSIPVNALYKEVLLLNKQKFITAFYSIDFFDNNSLAAQHIAFLDYALKINQNSLIFRLNYAQRFNKNGLQIESDYYHILKNSRYFYFNYGYAINNTIFPQHRAGLEYYFPLKHNFEASLGGRYLYFPNTHIIIATGHLAKYLNSFWIAIRPFYAMKESGNSFTSVVNIRKYGKTPLSYWGLELNYGNSPDDSFIINQTGDYFRLKSYKIKLEKNLKVGNTNELKFAAGYAYVEFITTNYRNRYIMEIIYKHRL